MGLPHLSENLYEIALDTSVVSCIVRLGTMETQMLNTTKVHSRLIDATATSSAPLWTNSVIDEPCQPGYGQALAWRRQR